MIDHYCCNCKEDFYMSMDGEHCLKCLPMLMSDRQWIGQVTELRRKLAYAKEDRKQYVAQLEGEGVRIIELRRRLKVAEEALAYIAPSDDHLWMKRWVMYSTKREEGELFIADMAVWLEDPKVIDAMKEQDRKLKVAEDALEWYAKSEAYADYVSKDVFGKPFVDKSTGLKARTALKQIREM